MSLNNSSTDDSTTSSFILNRVKFSILLALQIPSFGCSLYLFCQFAARPKFHLTLHNHVVLVLLCNSFLFVTIPVSASEAFFFTSHVRPERNVFCAFWTWIHYSINISNLILMAFACAERHWLVFRLNAMSTKRIRATCHYVPLVICTTYPWFFYFVFIFLYQCEPVYDFNELLCVMPCYFLNLRMANIDTFLNNWMPIFAIPILTGILFIRFLAQKHRMRIKIFQWKRDRKMVLQLLAITSLYVFMWSPLQAVAITNYIWHGGMATQFEIDYLYALPYFIHLLYPFVILFSNSDFTRRTRIATQEQQKTGQLQKMLKTTPMNPCVLERKRSEQVNVSAAYFSSEAISLLHKHLRLFVVFCPFLYSSSFFFMLNRSYLFSCRLVNVPADVFSSEESISSIFK
jgi:hypothetical protein